ncbi:unnamed protein product [Miscanthus lutarioriparius]|uniref:J domain-containing protein n=1 Tax=Miscanthus lutarioriparius TaxID=422564 RepID=A0A811N031_9POAL|nr:unnamed protein product [Miscanthus lutarioriparius]
MADSSKEKEEQARKAHALALAGNVLAAKMWMQSTHPRLVRRGLKPGGRANALTHDDIKKQHRRLCLLVHPDKNPSAAADGAFKLIQAAWHALLANHPPLGTAVPAPPPPQRQAAPPPRPPPEPQPRPWHRRPAPQATPRPAAPRPPTYYPKPAKPKQKSKCPACGGQTINGRNNAPTLVGRNNYRCMSCLWSPKDGRHEPHEEDCDDYDFD